MRIGIATDHGGLGLKEELVARIRAAGHEVVDFGAHSLDPDDDYPDFVVPLGQAVVAGKVDRGVAICGSGVGASVCANKVKGVRACLIHDHFCLFSRICGCVLARGDRRGCAGEPVAPLRAFGNHTTFSSPVSPCY